ncbi:hypothetical protein ACNOYE_12770 [Nannocystaceae bacterium ST9]
MLLAPAADPPNPLERALPKLTDQAEIFDVRLDIALAMLGLFLVALVWRSWRGDKPQLDELTTKRANLALTIALVVAALASSLNYFYAERNNGVWLHRWDAFHTVIGAKYFDELGYFDLYECAYAIDQQGPRHFRAVGEIRDLRNRDMVPHAELIADNDCVERFTPERLEQFRHDLDEFGKFSNTGMWKDLFKDKGFNGTPFYLWVTKTLVSRVDVGLESIRRLAYVDVVLMALAFLAVGRAFGVRVAAIVAIYFCVDFPNRFEHMGGSILRFDYVAALLIGFSAIKRERWALAGVLFAWATMVRVFPGVFVAGLALKLALDWRETRQLRPEHRRFATYFAGACGLMLVISLIGLEGGFANYLTWAEDMKIHTQTSAAYRVGFRHMFMLEGNLSSAEGFVGYGTKAKSFAAIESWYWLTVAVLIAPLIASARRLDTITFACLFGVFGFFLFTIATRYYYSVLCLLLLVDRDLLKDRYAIGLAALLFAGSAINFAYWQLNDYAAFMYNHVIGVELTLTIVVVGFWLIFDPGLRDRGVESAPEPKE